MYYKIENKECEVYKKLYNLRTKELQIEDENKLLIKEKTGLTFDKFYGLKGQQNFSRVTEYTGFAFNEISKVNLKIWKKHDDEIFVPNRRSKLGKEMSEFLLNGLKKSFHGDVYKILGLSNIGTFIFPYVDACDNGVIYLFLDNKLEPMDENLIEITKKEFEARYEQ